MAKDILDAIRAAEDDSREREERAKADAQNRIEQTKKLAQSKIAEAGALDAKDAERLCQQAAAESERLKAKSRRAADEKCESIHSVAEQRRGEVIEKTAALLLN